MRRWFSRMRFSRPKIVYSHEYFYGIPEGDSRGTFDVMKYKKIRDKLVKEHYLQRKRIMIPEMVSYEDMELVHTRDFLKSIQNPTNVSRFLKLGYMNPWDVYILEYFRIVAGGTLLAAQYALNNGGIVFNLGGGFHHSHPERADGFCLINDVAIAIEKCRKTKSDLRTLIVDLDYHQGDGNLMYFKDDKNVYTFSMHASHWVSIEKENNMDIKIDCEINGDDYLNILKKKLPPVCERFDPDFVIYIAGSDPYEKDTLGDMKLGRIDLLNRNMFVLENVKRKKIPMVVLAGGGYGPDSWEIYYDFIRESQL